MTEEDNRQLGTLSAAELTDLYRKGQATPVDATHASARRWGQG